MNRKIFWSALLLLQVFTAAVAFAGNSDTLFNALEGLKALPNLSMETIEENLKIKFSDQPDANPYWKFYISKPKKGPFSSIRFSEPVDGSSKKLISIVLDVRPSLRITLGDVQQKYGFGKISNIIPEAGPEGIVAHEYGDGIQKMTFEFTAKSKKLVSVVINRKR